MAQFCNSACAEFRAESTIRHRIVSQHTASINQSVATDFTHFCRYLQISLSSNQLQLVTDVCRWACGVFLSTDKPDVNSVSYVQNLQI